MNGENRETLFLTAYYDRGNKDLGVILAFQDALSRKCEDKYLTWEEADQVLEALRKQLDEYNALPDKPSPKRTMAARLYHEPEKEWFCLSVEQTENLYKRLKELKEGLGAQPQKEISNAED